MAGGAAIGVIDSRRIMNAGAVRRPLISGSQPWPARSPAEAGPTANSATDNVRNGLCWTKDARGPRHARCTSYESRFNPGRFNHNAER
jgi:hypothetical protein